MGRSQDKHSPPSVSSEEGYSIQIVDSGKSDEVSPSQDRGSGCVAGVQTHAI